jgi:16S rRNA processing protein RimM
MNLQGLIQIGRIINSHGIRGEVKVVPFSDDVAVFNDLPSVTVIDDRGLRRGCSITAARPFKHLWLLQLSGIDDMEGAKNLKGAGIYIDEALVRPLADDEFFLHDLINARVYTLDDQYLGVLTDYFEVGEQGICEVTAANDVFLFPVTEEVLIKVEPGVRVIVDLPPGLRDLNRKRDSSIDGLNV